MSKGRLQYNLTTHRLREIELIIAHRWGNVPETDDADIVFEQVADCLLRMHRKRKGAWLDLDESADRVKLWCERWAPWASIIECRDAAREALRRKRVDTADQCGARLRLSYEERTRLRITTIGSFDVNKRERAKRHKERKRIRDRERQATKRAERGAIPRAEYLAQSLARTQPWKRHDIKRRTWERRRRAADSNVNDLSRRQHDRAGRHRPRAGRAADPRHRRASRAVKEKEVAERELVQTLATKDASQSPSIKTVLVSDPLAPIWTEIGTNKEDGE
jgi:hypothetical protein